MFHVDVDYRHLRSYEDLKEAKRIAESWRANGSTARVRPQNERFESERPYTVNAINDGHAADCQGYTWERDAR